MPIGPPDDWPLPEHPELRRLAEELETARRVAEIFDAKWRLVYISSELASVIGAADPRPFLGLSSVQRDLEHPEIWGFTEDALRDALIAAHLRRGADRQLQPLESSDTRAT